MLVYEGGGIVNAKKFKPPDKPEKAESLQLLLEAA
jgi:hypothetical protein